jgi:hypothetical protein
MTEATIFTPEDLAATYPHQWLALRVLQRDSASGQPTLVEVIARDADMYAARTCLDKKEYCIAYTGPIPEEKYIAMF